MRIFVRPALPRWCSRLLAVCAALLLLYAALGFLILPALVQRKAPGALSRMLGRPVSLRQVRLNPFTLTATLDGFALREADGGDFLGWERLRVGLDLATLVTRSVAFRTIELVRPFGHVTVERGGRLNYADILARLGSGTPTPRGEARLVRIGRLSIQGAQVVFLDRSRSEPFATTLGPLSLELNGFSTRPNSRNPYAFAGRTEAGEQFRWDGDFSLEPLASKGTFSVERFVLPKYHPFYRDQVAFQVLDGTVSLRAGYEFRWSEGAHVMRLREGSMDLLDLQVAQGRTAPELVLPRVELRGVDADLVTRAASVASVALRDGRIALTRGADGAIDLVRMLTPRPQPPSPPAPPWKLELKELQVNGFQVAFRDRGTVRPVQALAEDLELTLKGFSLDPAASAQLKLALRLNGKARISAEGTVTPLRPALDLAVRIDHLGLPPFDPYLAPNLDVRLNRGLLSLDGRLKGTFAGGKGDFAAFRGNLRLDGFEAADGVHGEPFLGYRRLTLTGLDLRTHPDTLSIQTIDLLEPNPRLVVAPDGSTNVARALKLAPASGSPPLSALGSALPPSQGQPLKLTIVRTRMAAGRLSFVDRSVEPNAALVITGLGGSATSLSTEPDSQSEVDFQGLAGGIAPMRIQGRAMPLRKDQDTDVAITIQASELTDFSPYSGKFLGYTIQKGKLDLDAHVRIQKRQLEALVKTRMNQFYLGEKVASPEAVHAPVKLALAVLRDRSGLIELELPVTGSLDDPDLHYGRIILHALLNVLVKVATSPFTLLAKLGGGQDHDLSFVAFAAGSAEPDPLAVTKAQALAKALEARPELNLEAEGSTDPADLAALRQQALERALRRLKYGGADGPALEAERPVWLRIAFEKAFPKAAPAGPAPPEAEMEQRLLGAQPVGADDLRQLGSARAKALIRLLLEAQVDPGRLFEVSGGERAAQDGGSRVYFGLK